MLLVLLLVASIIPFKVKAEYYIPVIALKSFVKVVRGYHHPISKEINIIIFLKDKFLNLYINNHITEFNRSKVKISKNSSVKPIIVSLRKLIPVKFLLKSLKDRMLKGHLNIPINFILNKEVIV